MGETVIQRTGQSDPACDLRSDLKYVNKLDRERERVTQCRPTGRNNQIRYGSNRKVGQLFVCDLIF